MNEPYPNPSQAAEGPPRGLVHRIISFLGRRIPNDCFRIICFTTWHSVVPQPFNKIYFKIRERVFRWLPKHSLRSPLSLSEESIDDGVRVALR